MIAPTSTASSTSEVMRAGVETEMSTPQLSLKSHSLRELLMRLDDARNAELLFWRAS